MVTAANSCLSSTVNSIQLKDFGLKPKKSTAYCSYNSTGLGRNIPEEVSVENIDNHMYHVRVYIVWIPTWTPGW